MNTYLCGCEISDKLYEHAGTSVYRGRRVADDQAVIIKMVMDADAARDKSSTLRHEHAVMSDLGCDGVPRAFGLVYDQSSWCLLLEDIGGRSLAAERLAGSLSTEELLELGLGITNVLEQIHRRRVVHKDINPSNVIWNLAERRLMLIDFGIATVLPRETTAFVNPKGLEGTLAYISPEQTGRMNRSLDYRTDYYSLGVTLYELAAGRLPFDSADPLELVHCHIARQPPPLRELAPAIPQPVADIIHKLMAKSADDRYQSAGGIRADLARCLDELRSQGSISSFVPGQHDQLERFRLPQKLYGRDHEVERILAAFTSASAGQATLLMLSGYAGVGKSALIREVYRPLTLQRGYFISGKFDQYQNAPYAGFVQALRALIAQILTESQERIAHWREQIMGALHSNVKVLTDVCPELALITGAQPEADTLPPVDARSRFQQAVCALLGVIATAEHPLCMFIDDLQWSDADTLGLIEELMHAARGLPLLIIGAYRDSEVGKTHPLTLTLERLLEQKARIERLCLAPLGLSELTALVVDTLSMPSEAVGSLAELLYMRTGGNPFFVRAFLTALYDDELLVRTREGWRWDITLIRRRGITDNVVELVTGRIQRLPEATQELLAVAACVGNQFDLGTLMIAAARASDAIARDLWPALTEELVLVLDPVHSAVEMADGGPGIRCRFAHDRIQQAAVSRISGDKLAVLHRNIGLRLLEHTSAEEREQRLFEIVGHLNHGRPSTSNDAGELELLARLNLQAMYKALKAAAAGPALGYAQAGLALVGKDAWESCYELVRDLHIGAAEAAFANGQIEVTEQMAEAVLAHARSVFDLVRIWKLQGQVYYAQQRLQESLRMYRYALNQLGVALPEQVSPDERAREMQALAELLDDRAIEDLFDLPECTDSTARVAMEILDQLVAVGYTTSSDLFPVAICRLVELSVTKGNTSHSAYGYIFYGVLLSSVHDIERAYRFSRLAMRLADRFGDKDILSRTYLYAHAQIAHWKEPLYQLTPALFAAFRYGTEAGSRFHSAVSANTLCINRFLAGDELGNLRTDMARYSELLLQLRQSLLMGWHTVYEQAVINLHSGVANPCTFAGPAYDEAAQVPAYRANGDHASLFNYHYCKTVVCYLLGDFDCAADHAEAKEAYQSVASTAFWAAPLALIDSLALLAVYERADDSRKARIRETVASNQAKLARWLPLCPASYEHKLRLIEAELARVLGHQDAAAAAFDTAVSLARHSGYLHEAAMACELAARFYLATGRADMARDLLREAHSGYLRWGAITKIKSLEKQYPHLLPRVAISVLDSLTLSTARSHDWEMSVLDVLGVLSASQAISRQLTRDGLLTRLMELVMEIAGAEAGCLLIERGATWVLEVEKTVEQNAPTLAGSLPMDQLEERGHRGLPTALVRYVARTQESVVLDDATAAAEFGRDSYITRHKIKSAACIPLARQGGQRGMLYLENNLVTGAFTPARVQVLQLLSTQAVISLENVQLYNTLEQKVADRTRELDERNQELAAALARLRETQDRMIVQERLASLGALTAGLAHELRNPLNFVNNFANQSRKQASLVATELEPLWAQLGPEQVKRLERSLRILNLNLTKIIEHGQRIEGVIRSMLDHSRAGSGDRVSTNLNSLVQDYLKLAQHGWRSRTGAVDINFDTDLDLTLPPIAIVPQEIGRVFINLLENACYAVSTKFHARSGDFAPHIRICTRDLGARIEIRVRDNGTGIARDIRDRIFDPFFTTKQAGEGTGLGLSITHEIITKGYGGTIDLDSQDGEYTEFVVQIPK